MNLIEILKGARKRIEEVDYLSEGSYKEDNIMYGECYCAVGHIFKEMNVEDKNIALIEGDYIDTLDIEHLRNTYCDNPIVDAIQSLSDHESALRELQQVNDDSGDDERKLNVLNKIDEMIKTLEVDGTWKSK